MVLSVLWSSVAAAPAGAPAASERYQLPNGLRVVLAPDRVTPGVSVVVRYSLGAAKVAMRAELERLTSSNPTLVHYFATLFAPRRPPSFLAARPAAITAVTAVDIQRVARAYLRPQQLEVAVAGPVVLVNTLENVGEVEVYRVRRSTAGTASD